jgi:predicted RNase H-like HicB family nuclease
MAQIDYPMVVLPLSRENGGGYAAFVEDLPGCIADGETPAEALEELRQAVDEWIAEAVRLGREVPHPGSAAERAKREKDALKNLSARQRELIQKLSSWLHEQTMDIDGLKDRVETIEAQILELPSPPYDDEQGQLSEMTITGARPGVLYA